VNTRFIRVKEIMELARSQNKPIPYIGIRHCRRCGDTQPKHNFYPLYAMSYGPNGPDYTSDLECNRCRLTDEQYLEYFGEEKEEIEGNPNDDTFEEYGKLQLKIERKTFNANPLPLKGWKCKIDHVTGTVNLTKIKTIHWSYCRAWIKCKWELLKDFIWKKNKEKL